MGGQHRKGGPRRWPVVAFTAVLVVSAGGVIGVRALTSCRPVDMTIAADPAVAEPVRQALEGEGAVRCVTVRVVEASATQVDDIRSGATGLPVVWIPDSSLALGDLDTASGSIVDQGPSLASSPVVLVVPRADARRYGQIEQPISWNTLLTHPQPPALPDPRTDRAGLAALTALHTAIGDEGSRQRPGFVNAVLALSRGSLHSAAEGYARIDRDGGSARAFFASEQSVVRRMRAGATGKGGAPVEAIALREAAAALDFPFVRIHTRQPDGLADAVDAVEAQLRGPAGRQAFAAAGLRAPDGTRLPGPGGRESGWLSTRVPPAAPPPRPLAVETLRVWSSLTLRSQVLAAIDVSGSMAARAGNSDRITLTSAAAQSGLDLFPDTASVGLWAFSSRPPPRTPWQELVPIGPLTEPVAGAASRRAALTAATSTLPDRLGGGTALYDTVVAATRAVRTDYEQGSSNTVVLVTDGDDEASDKTDLPTALQTLVAEADPARPVPVIAIGLGPEADGEALRQIAQATGGRFYEADDPQDISGVIFDALSERGCRPGC
ncbi:MAG TPA: substrate-binding domain-containing protein [Pseudonocardia sp.]|nr:substrate-binding domain-containing protein [Pseudonocardia sp.]